ncbi:hypothetical protein CRU87_04095 [Aliarcobacter trophiarum LMG 25534]|uniref:Uncharacterized protein n=1 Tax=Aliarcobacter trophiarum LMG 25534 TaxID=1032241 RepID=A0AAD0QKX1_9BACT|nr:hypothetical protein [Aliarcobacter trophiarum]AXK49616.1 hypothetical protein ATR_1793 [Aliarcobacter trophiarum LMG 25534]RXJ92287.1 hypothetical protein CRU87_04095 [Aliarcobacter trophiarum LMG 25534]
MQTLILLFTIFIVILLLIYIFFKSKQNRLFSLLSGTCPSCKETKKVFFDKTSNTHFTQEIIKPRVLKDYGCSGVKDVEFLCTSCGLKELYSINSQMGCGI